MHDTVQHLLNPDRDGFIRLRLASLSFSSMHHLHSRIDEGLGDDLRSVGFETPKAGLTEWSVNGLPSASLGWDWYVSAVNNRMYAAVATLRTNLMLVDAKGYDLGEYGSTLLQSWLTQWPWDSRVRHALATNTFGARGNTRGPIALSH